MFFCLGLSASFLGHTPWLAGFGPGCLRAQDKLGIRMCPTFPTSPNHHSPGGSGGGSGRPFSIGARWFWAGSGADPKKLYIYVYIYIYAAGPVKNSKKRIGNR